MSGSQSEASNKKKLFEHTFHPANAVAGISKQLTLKQVGDLLEHGAAWTDKAKMVAGPPLRSV